jgi:E3 ubiquitin-protein ligase RNF115/126
MLSQTVTDEIEGFEDILERLMHAAGPQGPIPAADAVIDNLPRATFDEKGLGASVYKDCPVCKDDFAVGDEYIRIPCAYVLLQFDRRHRSNVGN